MRLGLFFFFLIAILGDFIANEKPLVCKIQGQFQFPAFRQKAIDWHLMTSDSVFYRRDWLAYNEYEFVIKAPIPYSSATIDKVNGKFIAPLQSSHLLGTDKLGRDVFAGLIHGCRIAFYIGIGVTFLALLIGVFLGATAGFFGGYWDMFVLQLIEIKRTIPNILWIFALAAIINRCTIIHIIIIIGGLSWTTIAQLMRSSIMKVKTEDYILTAKTLGLKNWVILIKHALPNSLSPIYVAASLMVSGAILAESSLSFLGIGLPIEEVTWGAMLNQVTSDINAWWMVLFPGACLFGVIILFNNLGERLRDLK